MIREYEPKPQAPPSARELAGVPNLKVTEKQTLISHLGPRPTDSLTSWEAEGFRVLVGGLGGNWFEKGRTVLTRAAGDKAGSL